MACVVVGSTFAGRFAALLTSEFCVSLNGVSITLQRMYKRTEKAQTLGFCLWPLEEDPVALQTESALLGVSGQSVEEGKPQEGKDFQ